MLSIKYGAPRREAALVHIPKGKCRWYITFNLWTAELEGRTWINEAPVGYSTLNLWLRSPMLKPLSETAVLNASITPLLHLVT